MWLEKERRVSLDGVQTFSFVQRPKVQGEMQGPGREGGDRPQAGSQGRRGIGGGGGAGERG